MKLMLMLINAPTPDRAFVDSYPIVGGSPTVGAGVSARADSSWRRRSADSRNEVAVKKIATISDRMLIDWGLFGPSRGDVIGFYLV